MNFPRPTKKELNLKLKAAKEALEKDEGIFANPSKAVSDLYELEIDDTHDLWPLITLLLEEIKADDYIGTKPPQKSYESTVYGEELFAFSWESEKLGKKMYIKFALKDCKFYFVSLHKNRPANKKLERGVK